MDNEIFISLENKINELFASIENGTFRVSEEVEDELDQAIKAQNNRVLEDNLTYARRIAREHFFD